MNLPEPDLLGIYVATEIYYDARAYVEKYGSECYAKGRADLLKEIGEPVAWRYDFSGDWWFTDNKEKVEGIKKQARVVQPLYVLPKEPTK